MSYSDWSGEFQELFESTPGASYLNDSEFPAAAALFEAGFTMSSAELDAAGYSPDDVAAIRDEFFDYMGIDAADFDWQEWREAMGYE